ncbi:Protein of unknown function [Pyronema omphalodes CBS 100304]|uniref:Uncharacterized protein n=1 Tax=Pyronema omphalodes (strain CBS 100304) TaxID=1076935 RepID=U4KXR0_PYROM|nr:Protein of unknown function [Pyronema omphalodes CBS 100304]
MYLSMNGGFVLLYESPIRYGTLFSIPSISTELDFGAGVIRISDQIL